MLKKKYMLTNQNPTLRASEQWGTGVRYLGSSRPGFESQLQYLHLPKPQFTHLKDGSNKTYHRTTGKRSRKWRQFPALSDPCKPRLGLG